MTLKLKYMHDPILRQPTSTVVKEDLEFISQVPEMAYLMLKEKASHSQPTK